MNDDKTVSENEKIAVMYLLNAISRADGKVEQEELDYLAFFTQQHHLELNEEEFKQQKLDTLCMDIKSKKAKVFALEQIIAISTCDGNYHAAERKAAMYLAHLLNISQEDFLSLEQQVIENIN